MLVRRVATGRCCVPGLMAVLLAGCAATPMGPTVQVMPGPGKSFDAFQVDNTGCKTFAAGQVQGQADAANQRAVGVALLGTVLGAGLGAAAGGISGDAGAGAALGAAVGAGTGTAYGAGNSSGDQMNIQMQYDAAFSQCMYAKGEQVPGFAPIRAALAPPGPAPVAADPLVRATQSELIRLGFLTGGADGFSGPRTRNAISTFEQANSLAVDGGASPRLLARLQATPTNAALPPAAAASAWVTPAVTPAATAATVPASSSWVAPVTRSP